MSEDAELNAIGLFLHDSVRPSEGSCYAMSARHPNVAAYFVWQMLLTSV